MLGVIILLCGVSVRSGGVLGVVSVWCRWYLLFGSWMNEWCVE